MDSEGNEQARFTFRRAHDHLLQGLIFFGAMFIIVAGFVSLWFWESSSWQRTGFASEQPIPFSHKHHVGELGIDCRYCHTGVETSAYPGVPPTETCMTCHSQIWTNAKILQPVRDSSQNGIPIVWNQVTNIPNYVYFNHSIHVSRGVACATCHGRVDEMPMTFQSVEMKMQWCLSCHRDPEKMLVPASQVTSPIPKKDPAFWESYSHPQLAHLSEIEKGRMTDCSVCHR